MCKILPLLAVAALAAPIAARAIEPSDYVHVPIVAYGEREIDFKMGSVKFKDDGGRETMGSLGFGYGVTPRWFTEAYIKYDRAPGERTRYDAFELENLFQLTEHNQYWADVGFLLEFEAPRQRAAGYEWAFGPLFQKDIDKLRLNANLLFGKVTSARDGEEHPLELGYQLQARYPIARDTDIGVQAFGDLGKWNDWNPQGEQDHRVGPAIFQKIRLGGRQVINWNAAWLVGVSSAAPRNQVRVQAELEF